MRASRVPMSKPLPNVFRGLKRLPEKFVSATAKLFRIDEVFMNILLATIALDDEERELLSADLMELAEDMHEPLEKLSSAIGGTMSGLLSAIPGLNIVYAVSDIATGVFDTQNSVDAGGRVLYKFVDRASKMYNGSRKSSDLLSSLLTAMGELRDETEMREFMEKEVGKNDIKRLKDIRAKHRGATLTRLFSKNPELSRLVSEIAEELKKDEDTEGIGNQIEKALSGKYPEKVLAGKEQEVRGAKGIGRFARPYSMAGLDESPSLV